MIDNDRELTEDEYNYPGTEEFRQKYLLSWTFRSVWRVWGFMSALRFLLKGE
jgi:hypothetical protein